MALISHQAVVVCADNAEFGVVQAWMTANGWPPGVGSIGERVDNVGQKRVTVSTTARLWKLHNGLWKAE